MLAQNFISHETLGIAQDEWAALIKVLGMLERNEIRHAPVDRRKTEFDAKPRKQPVAFNMVNVFSRTSCGTAACIAGSCDWFFGTKFSSGNHLRARVNGELERLFCPMDGATDWDEITTEQAARALRSYLTTGEARWKEAMAA